jgi:hypothetical protein
MGSVILASAAAGALWNRIRGDGITGGRYANALAFGTLVGIVSTPLTGALAAAAMIIGQAPGWGRYIGALGGWETKPLEEWAPADALIRWLQPVRCYPFLIGTRQQVEQWRPLWQLRAWGAAGLALRGLFWGACIFAGFALAQIIEYAISNFSWTLDFALGLYSAVSVSALPIVAGALMPLCYAAAMVVAKLSVPYGDNSWRGLAWEWGEYAFGALLWGATAMAVIS